MDAARANYDRAAHLDPEYAADLYYRKAVTAESTRRSAEADKVNAEALTTVNRVTAVTE